MSGRILIIEDDETLRVTVQNFLAKLGFEVRSAETGEAGLALAAQRGADLALVDLQLPGMSGLDVISRLAESGEDMVMVMMTAYPEVRTAVAALKSGAYDYINKPFDLEDLRGLVARACLLRSPAAGHLGQGRTAVDDMGGNARLCVACRAGSGVAVGERNRRHDSSGTHHLLFAGRHRRQCGADLFRRLQRTSAIVPNHGVSHNSRDGSAVPASRCLRHGRTTSGATWIHGAPMVYAG